MMKKTRESVMVYILMLSMFAAGMWTGYEFCKATKTRQIIELEGALLSKLKEER